MRFPQSAVDTRILLDQHNLARTTRRGFKAESAAAGKQVEAGLTGEVLTKPVEQGLAQPVGRRPQRLGIGKAYDPAAPLAADDAYLVGLQARQRRELTMCRRLACSLAKAPRSGRVGARDDHGYHAFGMNAPAPGILDLVKREAFDLGGEIIEIGQR